MHPDVRHPGSMCGVTFDVSVPRYLLGRTVGRVSDWSVFGPPSGLRLATVPVPRPPDDRWVELDVIAGGICGTDIGNLTYDASPVLEPFGSFPAVLGHEILARVRSVGPGVGAVAVGQRVAVDPIVSCLVRGFRPFEHCASCADGLPATCHHMGEPGRVRIGERPLAPGATVGYHRDLPGGWGERLVAHESQLYAVDDALDDRSAVLIEPLAVAVHAVVRIAPPRDAAVLVIGSGPIAMATVWALRALGHVGPVVAQAKRQHERHFMERLGAGSVIDPAAARTAMLATGARAYKPMVGPEVFAGGGFSVVFDCVGSQQTIAQALRCAAPRGSIAVVGCAGAMRRLDLTLVWARELAVRGFVGYGRERWQGETLHTFTLTQRLLRATDIPVADMVTHSYPLDRYRTALSAARHRSESGAIKVVLTPPVRPPLC
jgi:threonine dehydrogenase-like Zn-dependent dehydrogenase